VIFRFTSISIITLRVITVYYNILVEVMTIIICTICIYKKKIDNPEMLSPVYTQRLIARYAGHIK
jgi:hypothetical protein